MRQTRASQYGSVKRHRLQNPPMGRSFFCGGLYFALSRLTAAARHRMLSMFNTNCLSLYKNRSAFFLQKCNQTILGVLLMSKNLLCYLMTLFKRTRDFVSPEYVLRSGKVLMLLSNQLETTSLHILR